MGGNVVYETAGMGSSFVGCLSFRTAFLCSLISSVLVPSVWQNAQGGCSSLQTDPLHAKASLRTGQGRGITLMRDSVTKFKDQPCSERLTGPCI